MKWWWDRNDWQRMALLIVILAISKQLCYYESIIKFKFEFTFKICYAPQWNCNVIRYPLQVSCFGEDLACMIWWVSATAMLMIWRKAATCLFIMGALSIILLPSHPHWPLSCPRVRKGTRVLFQNYWKHVGEEHNSCTVNTNIDKQIICICVKNA